MRYDHHMSKKQYTRTVTILILSSVLAVLVGLIGAFNIYQNNKTDGLYSGQITVTSCQEKDWAWRIYSCTGDYFSTGGGMVSRSDVTVTVFGGEYKAGDIIADVYAPEFTTSQTTDHFVTGRERASVTYNMDWLLCVFLAVLLPIITLTFVLATRRGVNADSPRTQEPS